MIYLTGDITKTNHLFLIHGCNAQGKMGAGVAKAIRKKWPVAFQTYKEHLAMEPEPLGTVAYYSDGRILIGNIITQEYYGFDGKVYASVEAIEKGLNDFCRSTLYIADSPKIASSKIGCNLGGLNWELDVLPIYRKMESKYEVSFTIYEMES